LVRDYKRKVLSGFFIKILRKVLNHRFRRLKGFYFPRDGHIKMEKQQEDVRTHVYEVGYHIVPTIAEDNLPQEIEAVKALISKNGGSIISEENPKRRALAYTIIKKIGAVNKRFNEAYFGWVKFEAPTNGAEAIKEGFDKNENVLRYLLIKTVRENTLATIRVIPHPKSEVAEVKKVEKEEEKPAVKLSEEDIDKEIDDMIKE
jgi:ribosomal protein S6